HSLVADFTQTSSPMATSEPAGEIDSRAFSDGLNFAVDSMPMTVVLAAYPAVSDMASAMQAPSALPSTVAPTFSSGQSVAGASASCEAPVLGFDSAGLSDPPAEHPVSSTAAARITPTPPLLTRIGVPP